MRSGARYPSGRSAMGGFETVRSGATRRKKRTFVLWLDRAESCRSALAHAKRKADAKVEEGPRQEATLSGSSTDRFFVPTEDVAWSPPLTVLASPLALARAEAALSP